MPSVNCFRRVLLDVGGKKTIISVPHGMTETEVNKVLVVTRAYLQQYVYVEMVLAECFIQKIEKSILKKKCVRFEVKKKWVDCKKNLRKVVKYYDAYVPNADFNNEFAMTFYDKISGDLYKQTLNEASINATEDLTDEEKSSQRAYIGISDFMKSGYPLERTTTKKVS